MPMTLKMLRAGKKITQVEAAKQLGITPAAYSTLESIDEELIAKLAKLYGVKPEEIKLVS